MPRPLAPSLALAFLVLSACVEPPGADTGDDKPDGPDTCVAGDGPAFDVEATLTDIPTVVRVTWRTPTDMPGVVEFDTPTGPRRTATSHGMAHEVLLVGNRANSDVAFRVVTDTGTLLMCGEPRSITTGALPAGLPDLTVTLDPAHDVSGAGYTVAPVIQQVGAYVVILDAAGEYVWAWADDSGRYTGTYFNADIDLAREGIFVNEQALSAEQPGAIRHIAFDGTELGSVEMPGGHTDFVELPDGTIAGLSWDIREVDGTRYLGDRIVEVDTDGVERTVWSVWDHYTPDPDRPWPTGYYVADHDVLDWSHVNAISYDPGGDAYLLSLPFDQSVARVERATGAMTWALQGHGLVDAPHSVQTLGDTVLVFNRGDASDPSACSEATEVHLEREEAVWTYRSDRCLLVPFLGSALRLPSGNTLVDWSSAGQLDEVTYGGKLLWRVSLDLGAAFGFADRVDALHAD